MKIIIDNKEVEFYSLSVEGVDTADYPDFSDACITDGYFKDGTRLTAKELCKIEDRIAQELAFESLLD